MRSDKINWRVLTLALLLALPVSAAIGYGAGFDSGYGEAREVFETDTTPGVTCHIWAVNDTPSWMCFNTGGVDLAINPNSTDSGQLTLEGLPVEESYKTNKEEAG